MSALGMYPTNSDGTPNACYDPSRPWWMPNFIDTWEEGQCKYKWLPFVDGPDLNPAVGGTPANPNGALDSTVSSIAGIVIVLGLAHIALQAYVSARR